MSRRGPVVKVEGAKRLRQTMHDAGVDLQELKDAHKAVAGQVQRAASAPHLTGALAASVKPGATKNAALIRAGSARVRYAGAIHWGWPKHNIASNPFLLDAAQRTEPEWTHTYEEAVDKILAHIKGE